MVACQEQFSANLSPAQAAMRPSLRTMVYCGDLRQGVIAIGACDIIFSVGFITYALVLVANSNGLEEMGEVYLATTLASSCIMEARRPDGRFNLLKSLRCARCWDELSNETRLAEEDAGRANSCLVRYMPNISLACQDRVAALEVGEENLQETRDMLACFRSYVRDNDEDGSVAAYVAERADSWGLGEEEYEAFSKEVRPTEFSTIMDLLQFVCYIFILVVGSLLTYGGYKERPGFTLPWLVVYFLYILLSFVSVISQQLKWIVVADWMFWLEVSALVVDIYCYFLVWAFRRELLLGRALV